MLIFFLSFFYATFRAKISENVYSRYVSLVQSDENYNLKYNL